MVYVRAMLVWLIIVFAESLHGTARRLLLEPSLGDLRARQVSVFTGSLIILAIAVLCIRWIRATTISQCIVIGILWVLLTIGFEIGLGLLLGYSWERIAADYKIQEGGLMAIGLVFMALTPLLAAKIRKII